MMKKYKLMALILMLVTVLNLAIAKPILADEINNGGKIFEIHCAGCHANGGNIIRRGKNLYLPALKKFQMDNIDAITNLVTNGKNNMSSFKDRLTETEINTVANYVLDQARKQWK
jgi:cytochrome c6